MPMTASLPRGRPIALGGDRLRRARDGAGRAPRFALWHDQHPVRPGGGERRALGDAPAAGRAKHRRRALGQTRRLGEEARGRKKPRRHAELRGERVDPRLGELQLDRHDRRDRPRRQPRLGQRRARQIRDFLARSSRARSRCRAPAPADGRPGRRFPLSRAVGHDDPLGRRLPPSGSPRRAATRRSRSRRPSETGSPRSSAAATGLTLLRIGDAPARRRLVESEAEAQIAGRGDRRDAAR